MEDLQSQKDILKVRSLNALIAVGLRFSSCLMFKAMFCSVNSMCGNLSILMCSQGIEKDLESMGWEVAAILEYGETLCKDKSIFDKEKETIRHDMNAMQTAFTNSQTNVEERKLR